MGIHDLLAQISGDGDKSVNSRTEGDDHKGPKRKAETDLRGVSSKMQRTMPVPNGASTAPSDSNRPSQTLSRSFSGPSSTSKASTQPRPRPATDTNKLAGSTRSAKPLPLALARETASSVTPAVKATPKKGSYQEILARAQKAQATMGQVGKINHKPLEKGPTKRERQELKARQAKGAKRGVAGPGSRGHSATNQRAGPISQEQSQSNGGSKKILGVRGPKPGIEEDKKPKKAALATTGYQGTARPRPGAANLKAGASAAESTAASSDRNRPLAFQRAHRSRLDEYDEMDDFIDDEEEDDDRNLSGYENGRMQKSYHHYMSEEEDESDMEAGLSDIDQEERRAELYARREDQEQERIEQDLKNKKEERRRQYAQLGDARRAR